MRYMIFFHLELILAMHLGRRWAGGGEREYENEFTITKVKDAGKDHELRICNSNTGRQVVLVVSHDFRFDLHVTIIPLVKTILFPTNRILAFKNMKHRYAECL